MPIQSQNAFIVGSTRGVLREITFPLIRSGFAVRAFIPKDDPLWSSREQIERIEIPDIEGDELVHLIESEGLFEEEEGWFFWNSLSTLKSIYNSNLPEDIKSKLLNDLNLTEGRILGSRVNQVKLFEQLGVGHPKSIYIDSRDQLTKIPASENSIYKLDFGGAGEGVGNFSEEEKRLLLEKQDTKYPLLIQEKFDGDTIHVEVLFEKGKIVSWALSRNSSRDFGYGYCPSRIYSSPSDLGFLDEISKIGAHLGVSGPAGVAFIEDKNDKLRIIEFDLNVGLWHHLLPVFNSRTKYGRYYDPYRAFQALLSERKYSSALVVLLGWPLRGFGRAMPSSFSAFSIRYRYAKRLARHVITHSLDH